VEIWKSHLQRLGNQGGLFFPRLHQPPISRRTYQRWVSPGIDHLADEALFTSWSRMNQVTA